MSKTHLTRYDIRKDSGLDTWEIIDTWTGQVAVIDGEARTGLKLDDSSDYADLLNSEGIEPDEETRH